MHHWGGSERIQRKDNILQRCLIFVKPDELAFFIRQRSNIDIMARRRKRFKNFSAVTFGVTALVPDLVYARCCRRSVIRMQAFDPGKKNPGIGGKVYFL
jgi:hypothetical protein